MSTRLVVALAIGLATAVHASDNSIEVTLEDNPDHAPKTIRHWKFEPGKNTRPDPRPAAREWNEFLHWRYKFYTASDKQLGSSADVSAIEAAIGSSESPNIRWISRSVVAAHADHCLFVLQRHGTRWKVSHRYSASIPAIIRSNQSMKPTQYFVVSSS